MKESAEQGANLAVSIFFETFKNMFKLNPAFWISFILAGIFTGIIFRLGRERGIWFGKRWGKLIAMVSFAITFYIVRLITQIFE